MARDCTSYGPQRHTARNPRTVNQLWLPDRNVTGRTEPRKYINVSSLITRAHYLLPNLWYISIFCLQHANLKLSATRLPDNPGNLESVYKLITSVMSMDPWTICMKPAIVCEETFIYKSLCRANYNHLRAAKPHSWKQTCSNSYSVLLCTTVLRDSSTTLYYKVLLEYYSVLESPTPVLVCTTKYYSSTTLYYKVLLQYYSVLQSTTPVLLCTTKYYSSTALYYKVLLQYYSVLQSATPVLLSWLTRITYETLVTMRGAKEMSLQHHQILRLPRKVTLIIDPLHTWNVIYNARSNMRHSPNSPNTAPATKSNTHHWSSSHMKRYLQCAE